ncbi:class I SAM-dependent methyltransferase [Actinomycetospora soli]|uniref:class I SAM-dependent methyltransferase n=1 Tax=Actinomycetospora soli TaxID=2893887 RepID=UPI001E582648|nr:class I SAM-dependent methyltransferase [Actinomycetospora soli]MCD2189627.1 class I SAM-dependent methyltransferase [Actinomycetospora soli]
MSTLLLDRPELYEAWFPDPDATAARFVADVAVRFGAPGERLLDAGCGTGRDAAALAARGWTASALDLAPAMVEHVRRHHRAVDAHQGDLRTLDLGRAFDVVSCLDSTLLALHDTADLLAALRRVAAHLVPGGLFVAEMRNGAFLLTAAAHRDLLGGETERVRTHDGVAYTARTLLAVDHAAQLLRRRRTWTWPGGEHTEHTAWRLLFPRELTDLLDRAGFDVLALFDTPGPRTDEPWHPDAALGTALTRDRLHVVARRRDLEETS